MKRQQKPNTEYRTHIGIENQYSDAHEMDQDHRRGTIRVDDGSFHFLVRSVRSHIPSGSVSATRPGTKTSLG